MSIITGFVGGWNTSCTEKSIRFYILQKTSGSKRKADEIEQDDIPQDLPKLEDEAEELKIDADEVTLAEYIPLQKNTSLPSYSSFLKYTIQIFKEPEELVYKVCKIIRIGKLEEFIYKPKLMAIMFEGKTNEQKEILKKTMLKVPAKITNEILHLQSCIKSKKVFAWVKSLTHMFFKSTIMYELMKYFPYVFLSQFNDIELKYIKGYMTLKPFAFCFPAMVKRDLKCISYPPIQTTPTPIILSPITGLPVKKLTESKTILFNQPISIYDNTDKRFHNTGDVYWKHKEDKDSIHMTMSYPYWNGQLFECFCMDYQQEIGGTQITRADIFSIIQIYMFLENRYYSYGIYECSLDYLSSKLSKPIEDIKIFVEFLIETNILSRYIINQLELSTSEPIVFKNIVELDDQIFNFFKDICTEIYFLSTSYYCIEYFQTIQKLHSQYNIGLVITHSVFSQKYIREEIGLNTILWNQLQSSREKIGKESLRSVMIEGIHKIDLNILVYICNILRGMAVKDDFKIILIGDNNEYSSFSKCFTCNYVLESLCSSFKVDSDMIRKQINNPNEIISGIDNLLEESMTDLIIENIQDIKTVSKCCKLSKIEKKEKKTLQLFCSTEFDKDTLLKDLCVNEKQYGGPNRFSIGDKIQCIEDGWCGEIKTAQIFQESGIWKNIDAKEFIYIQRAPHKLEVMFDKLEIQTIFTRRKTIRHLLFETARGYSGIRVDRGIFYLTSSSTIQDVLSCIKYCKSQFKILVPKDITLQSMFSKQKYTKSKAFTKKIDMIKYKIQFLN
jgi:hypothetical protein